MEAGLTPWGVMSDRGPEERAVADAPRIAAAAAGPGSDDHKTRLQELVVHMHGHAPRYDVVGSGPDHDRRFTAIVFVAGDQVGSGVGRSKKDAEQAAARAAWK